MNALENFMEEHGFLGNDGGKYFEMEFTDDDIMLFDLEQLEELLEINIAHENYEGAVLIKKAIANKKLDNK